MPEDHYKVFRSITKFSYVFLHDVLRVLNIKAKNRVNLFCSPLEFRDRIARNGLIHASVENPGEGIPQGSPMSCVLANIYMLEFDAAMNDLATNAAGMYRRYSDDIFLAFPEHEDVAHGVGRLLESLGLKVNDEKTERYTFEAGAPSPITRVSEEGAIPVNKIMYLGVNFDGESLWLRHGGVAKFQRKRVAAVKRQKNIAVKNKKPLSLVSVRRDFTRVGRKRTYLSYADRAGLVLESSRIQRKFTEKRMNIEIRKLVELPVKKRKRKRVRGIS